MGFGRVSVRVRLRFSFGFSFASGSGFSFSVSFGFAFAFGFGLAFGVTRVFMSIFTSIFRFHVHFRLLRLSRGRVRLSISHQHPPSALINSVYARYHIWLGRNRVGKHIKTVSKRSNVKIQGQPNPTQPNPKKSAKNEVRNRYFFLHFCFVLSNQIFQRCRVLVSL